MQTKYKIVFRGEILPGHDPAGVKQRAATVFKLDPVKLEEKLFTGRPVVLVKDLDSQQLEQYVKKLENLGLKIYQLKESGTATDTSAQKQSDQAPELMTCPKCGYQQPRRTLCQQCATDMPAFIAAQQKVAHEKAEEAKKAANPVEVREAPEIPDNQYSTMFMLPDSPPLLGFDLEGRFTRQSYVTATGSKYLIIFAATMLIALVTGLTGLALFALLLIVVLLGGMYWIIRDAALRLHDLRVSGWFSLLLLIPYVGILITFALALVPGKVEENEYGPPTQPHSMITAVLAVFPFILFPIWAGVSPSSLTGNMTKSRNTEAVAERKLGEHPIIMYSRSDCTPCDQKRAELKQERVEFTEYFIDKNPEHQTIMNEKLAEQDISLSAASLPVFDAYGTMLVGNPSTGQIRVTAMQNIMEEVKK